MGMNIDEIERIAKRSERLSENRVMAILTGDEPVYGITVKFSNKPGIVVRAEDGRVYTTNHWVAVEKTTFLLRYLTEREMLATTERFFEVREKWFDIRMRKNNMDDVQYPYVLALICDATRLRELDHLVAETSIGNAEMDAGKRFLNEFLEMDLMEKE